MSFRSLSTSFLVKHGSHVACSEVSEANQRELAAVFSAVVKDFHEHLESVASTEHGKAVDELTELFNRIGLQEHITKFREEGIDLDAARKLSDEHFAELGLDYNARSTLSSVRNSRIDHDGRSLSHAPPPFRHSQTTPPLAYGSLLHTKMLPLCISSYLLATVFSPRLSSRMAASLASSPG